MMFKKILRFRREIKYMTETLQKVKSLSDAINLLNTIPNEDKYETIERSVIKACFLKMSSSEDVQNVLRLLVDRFDEDSEKFNDYMEMMNRYLELVSVDDIEFLAPALAACEQIPRQILPSEMYYFEEPVETTYEIKVIAKMRQIVTGMFDGVNDIKSAFRVLDDVIEIANRHSAFNGSFQATERAVEIVLSYIICLDEAEKLYETYKRCGCISITTLGQIQYKYLEIGSDIADRTKTIDGLINFMQSIPNHHNDLYGYIISRIDKIGLATDIVKIETKKLIEYDKNIPNGKFKDVIRDELVARLDTTKK